MPLRPVMFRWKEADICVEGGEVRRVPVMVPHQRFAQLCKRQYTFGEDYALGPVEGVPSRSRAHFFAAVRDAWDNLPEENRRWPTAEHFRKWLLVQVGWRNESTHPLETVKDAQAMAVALRADDEFAVIVRKGSTVWFATAKSIATNAIKKDEWGPVKEAALDLAASLARTTRPELERHSREGSA